jgi:hypothetical protein
MSTEINRITDKNIYTILESEVELERQSEVESAVEVESCNVEKELIMYKNEKKVNVYKIMKEYVNKHGKKY